MRYYLPITIVLALLAFGADQASAQNPTFEKTAAKLHAATVTVRVIPAQPEAAVAQQSAEEPVAAVAKSVTVCSGASLGDGLVITYAEIGTQDEVRVTIPGGEQATAKLKVLDHISGLTLLEMDKLDIPAITTAKQTPTVGAWVLSGAGWGSEQPVVSFGILAGVNRTMRGSTFPPLLQCDLRTADTSNGAPLVNSAGELIGIVVASGSGEGDRRWTYAVPVKHVERLVRARHPERMIEIKKVRPVVGMHLDLGDTPNTVIVRRVAEGGPADKAGVQVGDHIVLAEGMNIRSPYQVIGPLLAKQPGEAMNFTMLRGETQQNIEIVLDGGTVLQPRPSYNNVVGLQSAGSVGVSRRVFLSADGPPQEEIVIQRNSAAPMSAVAQEIDELELQHRAITKYLSALQQMQDKLKRQEKELSQRDAQIQALQEQLRELQDAARR